MYDLNSDFNQMKIFTPSSGFKPMPQGTVLVKRYRIEGFIKVGGMGAIYRVLDIKLGKILALKQMLAKFPSRHERQMQVDNFISEIQILKGLKHPNVPRFYDAFVENDSFFFVMEYIKGQDLQRLARKEYPNGVPQEIVVEWALQITRALEYLHSLVPPVVHRDIKPANIMLRETDGLLKLIDFGISRPRTKDYVFGTPGYSPPEQFMDPSRVVPTDDLFALAMTMYYLLTLQHPPTDYSLDIHTKLQSYNIRPGLIDTLARAIGQADTRFSSASEFRASLEETFPEVKLKVDSLYANLKQSDTEVYRRVVIDVLIPYLRRISQLGMPLITSHSGGTPLNEDKVINDILQQDYVEIDLDGFGTNYLILKFKQGKLDVLFKPKLLSLEHIATVEMQGKPKDEVRQEIIEVLKRIEAYLNY